MMSVMGGTLTFEACRANIDYLGLSQPEPLVRVDALFLAQR